MSIGHPFGIGQFQPSVVKSTWGSLVRLRMRGEIIELLDQEESHVAQEDRLADPPIIHYLVLACETLFLSTGFIEPAIVFKIWHHINAEVYAQGTSSLFIATCCTGSS